MRTFLRILIVVLCALVLGVLLNQGNNQGVHWRTLLTANPFIIQSDTEVFVAPDKAYFYLMGDDAVFFDIRSFDKIAHPFAFAEMVENYQVIGKSLSLWVAVWIPATEMLLGLMLIFGLWPVASLLLNAGLMCGFLLFVSQAYLRGLNIECGCYGGEGSTIGPVKIVQNLFLTSLSLWLWIRVRSFQIKLEKIS